MPSMGPRCGRGAGGTVLHDGSSVPGAASVRGNAGLVGVGDTQARRVESLGC